MKRVPAEERFVRFYEVDPISGCWMWTGGLDHRGYGMFWNGSGGVRAYRWAYEHWVGPVPPGYHLDHFRCDRPACVNPHHVRPTTPRENILRGNGVAAMHLAQTHCKRGHEFTPENTYLNPAGSRTCKGCQLIHQRTYRRKRRQREIAMVP